MAVPFFSRPEFDGLFGLGISDDKRRKTLIYDNIPRGRSKKNVFSIYYPKNVDDDGAITFGGYDKKFIQPNEKIDWFDVSSRKYWAVKMIGLKINGVFLDVCSKNIGEQKEYELTPADYIVNSFKVDPVLKSPCNFAFMPINISSANRYLYVRAVDKTHKGILGQIFLQKYYAIFEKDKMKIGNI
ncbi:hypothetical protein PVIIG_00092 [Plasmodium vivax India VII]|uniref:Peptidase A1 domain-containing protein n=1 Tax=Plasmodium vivax India VII TaxID=1077284 RepID=A0A0J9S9R2_PLAVI|nr:hypothetical protein PVIIG_00092 [Plasmodium vivax India VII]